MKVRDNGILREATILPVHKGSFFISPYSVRPEFPQFCAICEPTDSEIEDDSDISVTILPIMNFLDGVGVTTREELETTVSEYTVKSIIKCIQREMHPSEFDFRLREAIREFVGHSIPFQQEAVEYIKSLQKPWLFNDLLENVRKF